MKVMCILPDTHIWITMVSGFKRRVKGPKYGETCTVTDVKSAGYHLEEYPVGEEYEMRWFIPFSDKDETDYADEVLEKLFEPVKS